MDGCAGIGLKQDLIEIALDIEALISQTVAAFVDCARYRQVDDNLVQLTSLFFAKADIFKKVVRRVNVHTEKDAQISELKEALRLRDERILDETMKVTEAFKKVSDASFSAKKMICQANPSKNLINPEDVIRLSHLISRNFSVASPHFWQLGDPMRPFPTDIHFRSGHIGNMEGIKSPKILQIKRSTKFLGEISSDEDSSEGDDF